MRYSTNAVFLKTLKRLSPSEQLQIKQRIDIFVRALEGRDLPTGLGLKQLRPKLWEIRTSLDERVLFWWTGGDLEFTFVGSHDEVRRFLKHL